MLSIDTMAELSRIHRDSFHERGLIEPWSLEDIRFLSLSLCGEAGELANIVKKEWRGDKVESPYHNRKLHEEVADCAAYVALLACALGINLDEIISRKLPAIREKLRA